VLAWALLALTLYLVGQSLNALLGEVELGTTGGMGALASGFSAGVVPTTRSLLGTWALAAKGNPATHDMIVWTARGYTLVTLLLCAAYALVLVRLLKRVRQHLPAMTADNRPTSRLRRAAYWNHAALFSIGAAAFDGVANLLRLLFVEQGVGGATVSSPLIRLAWAFDTAHVALLALAGVVLVVLLHDTGRLRTWIRHGTRAAWRLRVVVLVVTIYCVLLLVDITGQSTDLVRRWADDLSGLGAGLLVLASAALLAFSVWLYARRVVLSEQPQARRPVPWTLVLLASAVVTAVLAFGFAWTELYAFTGISILLVVANWVLRNRSLLGRQAETVAEIQRRRDAGSPPHDEVPAIRRAARALAAAVPVSLLLLVAQAYAPVLLVLTTSGERRDTTFDVGLALVVVAIAGTPLAGMGLCALLRVWDGPLRQTPNRVEWRYVIGAAAVVVVFGVSVAGAVLHWPAVTALLAVAAVLAMLMLLLGEGQRWSETHTAPGGVLGLGFTRLPVVTITLVGLVAGNLLFNNGHSHNVYDQGTLPATMTAADGTRTGVDLSTAFDQWVAGNCAGSGHAGSTVPLILVTAPGGGLRAAYWTASTLTAIFGPDRSTPVPSCPGAAAPDRIFAMGGASGGSLGVLAYEAGLSGTRSATWYADQIGRPDFLTDPLTWLLTVDAARAFIGYGGEDRARRMSDDFAEHVTGLGDDFFAGTWGLSGRSPLMLLTATQVESGCRLNLSGLRLTDPTSRAEGQSCAAIGRGEARADAPVTTDVLDVLCDAGGHAPASLSRATAALLSARFPYISPSGQMYSCLSSTGVTGSTAIVDGGYADNTGLQMLLSLWPRLEPLIAAHNQQAGNATIVPILVDVANTYAQVAAPVAAGRTAESLVPIVTYSRPGSLSEQSEDQQANATFNGPVPGLVGACDLTAGLGRFLAISPTTSPGLPAPLAWTLSKLATDDLDAQRTAALQDAGPTALASWAQTGVTCA
jgi:hypothetical protein